MPSIFTIKERLNALRTPEGEKNFEIDVQRDPSRYIYTIVLKEKPTGFVASLEVKQSDLHGGGQVKEAQILYELVEQIEQQRQAEQWRKKKLQEQIEPKAKKSDVDETMGTISEELAKLKSQGKLPDAGAGYKPGSYQGYQGYHYQPGGKASMEIQKAHWQQVEEQRRQLEQAVEQERKRFQRLLEATKGGQKGSYDEEGGEEGEEMPPKQREEYEKVAEANKILTLRHQSGTQVTVFIEPPEWVMGVNYSDRRPTSVTGYRTLREVARKAITTNSGFGWFWEKVHEREVNFINPYGEWVLDLGEAVKKKDREAVNTAIYNLQMEWWREKGLLK